jgi:hypothetical protein
VTLLVAVVVTTAEVTVVVAEALPPAEAVARYALQRARPPEMAELRSLPAVQAPRIQAPALAWTVGRWG